MSEAPQVDLSQIRGDWHFHLNYLGNAVHHTLKRARSMWTAVADDVGNPAIGRQLETVADVWKRLNETGDKRDPFDISSGLLDEFIAAAAATKEPCDALEEERGLSGSASIYDNELEQFTEAVRQLRSFGDDLQMMREQKP